MPLDTEFETTRMLSLLSERPHEIIQEDKSYVAFAGYLLTYSTFCTIFMWSLAGPKIYHSIWKEREGAIKEVRDLNPQDGRLPALHDDHVGQYITDRFKLAMKAMDPDDIEDFIHGMFCSSPA